MAMNRVFRTLLLLSYLCASICALRFSIRPRINRPRANGSCRKANWWSSFDKTGWSKCPATSPYINGLYRNRASQANRDWIYLLEEAKCCGNGNSNAECVQVNWVASFDRNRNWNLCPSGYYLSGLYRSAGHNLHNIEYAWCCKPPGAPNSYKSCYNENVWSRFDWNRKGMVSCTRSGYYITGLYRSVCNFMYCIEEFKCCQLPTAKAPQTAPTPTAQVTSTTSSNWFQIQSSGYNKCLTASYVTRRGVYRKPFNGKTQTYRYFLTTRVALYLSDCAYLSTKQSWRWTSGGRLQSDLNQQCLTVTSVWNGYLGKRYGASLQPCNSTTSNQGWVCNGGYLKLKNKNLYLVPFIYSGRQRPSGGITVRSSVTNSCLWTRYGTSKSICANGKATTTRDPMTTQIISTQMSTTIVTTTNTPATTTIPSTTQPPVPPTDDIGTPPLPPTGTLITPPIPANTPPVPPFPRNTPPVVTTTKPPPPQGNKKIRCGTKGRIGGVVNGTRAAAGSWPWQVGIKKCTHCNITCGGTLINDEWVVTAAHCVSGWFPDELYIVIGEVDQSTKSGDEQRFRCTKIIIHEDYGIDVPYDKDIALIRLDKYAVYNDNVRPLCMPGSGTVLTEKDLCTVTGFGRVAQNGVKSARLLEAKVKIVPFNTCVKSYASLLNPRKVTSNMFCAGYKKGGTDACQGDSGGPLTCFDRSNFRFILGGVVSWGVGCAQPDLYGVYTNTALFTPWVQKKLAAFGY